MAFVCWGLLPQSLVITNVVDTLKRSPTSYNAPPWGYPIYNLYVCTYVKARFTTSGQVWSRLASFKADCSFYRINWWYEFLYGGCSHVLLEQNLRSNAVSFLDNLANHLNDQHKGWPVLKQASTVSVSIQPLLELADTLPRYYCVLKPSILSQPVL